MNEEYRIVREDGNEVVIERNKGNGKITYMIGKEDGVLRYLYIEADPCDIDIPHIFPSGHTINTLGLSFLRGVAKKVTVSKEIGVRPRAFKFSCCEEVVWPGECKVIPEFCFFKSSISKLTNISCVEVVEYAAFYGSQLHELDLSDTNISLMLPSSLSGLPEGCNPVLPYYVSSKNLYCV